MSDQYEQFEFNLYPELPYTLPPVPPPPPVFFPQEPTPYLPPSLPAPTYAPPSLSAPTYAPPSLSAPTYAPPSLSAPLSLSAPTYTPPSLSTPAYTPPSLSELLSLSVPAYTPPSLSVPTSWPVLPSLSASTYIPPPPPLCSGPEVPPTSAGSTSVKPPQGHENASRGTKRQSDSDNSGQAVPPNQRARTARPEPDFRKHIVTAEHPSKSIQKHFVQKFRAAVGKLGALDSECASDGFKWADMVARNVNIQMNFTRTYVTIGVEQLMIAVELRDNPTLKGKPFMICTRTMVHDANDIAKAAGVSDEMTIASALRKCKDIIVVQADFPKYIGVIKEIRKILRVYDEDLRLTKETAHLDLTGFINSRAVMAPYIRVLDVVHEMRTKIYNKLRLHTYAGIGPTPLLAKMASTTKRPNQVMSIDSSRAAVEEFLKGYRISEHCGICPRTTYVLKSLALETVTDVWKKRGILYFLLSLRSFQRLIAICLGGNVDDPNDNFQVWDLLPHSITKHLNMYGTKNVNFLKKVCAEVCIQMELELKSMRVAGQYVLIGITTTENETVKRAFKLHKVSNDAALLFKMLSRFLGRFMKQMPTVLISQIRVHMLKLSRVEFIAPSNTIICEKNVFPRNKENQGEVQSSPFPTALFNSTAARKRRLNRPSSPRVMLKVVPFPGSPKPVYICPNCSLRIQPGTDHNGENIMSRHVDYCLMATFPDLGWEPPQ
ncbi:unnamed protein product [Orchesella dallaii]|uniref:UmuC domain-containing protein n=1 Tax=Orchesella dallaii TaxID=48710 RepID=A0ABP1R5Y6_9HEXA